MSYILDALKRAEAERERGAVPGLHSQPLARSGAVPVGGVLTVAWLVAGSSLALVVLAAVIWFWRESVPQRPAAVAQSAPLPMVEPAVGKPPMPQTAAAQPELATTPTDPSAPNALVAPPVVTLPVSKTEAKPTPVQMSVPTPAKASVSASASASATAAVPRVSPAAAKVGVPVPAIPVASSSQAVMPKVALLNELPEDLRRQIPPLVITGVVYSDSPTQSLLLVNKLVLTQGNLAAPEVMLERIHLHHAVFSFRGTQFTLSY
jgi:general secretion pathway protein B